MADSQNTYQNDVKIKSGISFSTIVYAIIIIAFIGFGGYSFYDSQITKAYDSGYEIGYSEAKAESKNQYTKGYNAGHIDGKNEGYNEGYKQGKEDSKSSSGSGNKNGSSGYYGGSNNYSSNNEKEYSYILNKNTYKFHYSWCDSVGRMKERNKVYFDGTRTEAVNKGYAPCKNCNP